RIRTWLSDDAVQECCVAGRAPLKLPRCVTRGIGWASITWRAIGAQKNETRAGRRLLRLSWFFLGASAALCSPHFIARGCTIHCAGVPARFLRQTENAR